MVTVKTVEQESSNGDRKLTGIDLIREARNHMIETEEIVDSMEPGTLVASAVSLAVGSFEVFVGRDGEVIPLVVEDEVGNVQSVNLDLGEGNDYLIRLVNAGASIAAEIDRVQAVGPFVLECNCISCRAVDVVEQNGIYAVPHEFGGEKGWVPRMPDGSEPSKDFLRLHKPMKCGWPTWSEAVRALAKWLGK